MQIRKLDSTIVPLASEFQVDPSCCGYPEHYEFYLRCVALDDYHRGRGVTYIMLDDGIDPNRIVGYITLRASSLIKEGDRRRQGHAAIEITELAVDKDYRGRGHGIDLVAFAIDRALTLSKDHIGIEYIILCADPAAVGFYSSPHFGFTAIEDVYEVPREGWNDDCVPMSLRLDLRARAVPARFVFRKPRVRKKIQQESAVVS